MPAIFQATDPDVENIFVSVNASYPVKAGWVDAIDAEQASILNEKVKVYVADVRKGVSGDIEDWLLATGHANRLYEESFEQPKGSAQRKDKMLLSLALEAWSLAH